eukprot:SAG11_NODE_4664_length_1816_cov_2.025044_2_plen_58_part_00
MEDFWPPSDFQARIEESENKNEVIKIMQTYNHTMIHALVFIIMYNLTPVEQLRIVVF